MILGAAVGDVVAGKYRIERVLGSGGTAVVVAARHLQLGDTVALKLMLSAQAPSPEVAARFLREAKAAVRLKSDHVARILDVGQLDDGTPFIVMEYLEGQDLAQYLREHGVLPPEEVVDYVLQACAALAEAHALGIVHRDVKPHNLFLTARKGVPHLKVLDFGSVKTSFAVTGCLQTQSTAILGSPAYMSPEQMRSCRDVDPRADVWSLGVVMYQLLAGRLPFEASTLPDLCLKVTKERPPPLRGIRPVVPARLAAVVEQCLEKDRAARIPCVANLARALGPFAPPRSRPCLEALLQGAPAEPAPSRSRRALGIAAALVAAGAIAGIVLARQAGSAKAPATPDAGPLSSGPAVEIADAAPAVVSESAPTTTDAGGVVAPAPTPARHPLRAPRRSGRAPSPPAAPAAPASQPAASAASEDEDFGPRK